MKNMKALKQIIIAAIFITAVFACKKSDKTNVEFTFITVADSTGNYTDDTTINCFISISYYDAKCNGNKTFLADSINKDFFAWLSISEDSEIVVTRDNLKECVAAEINRFIKEINEDESLADCESCRYSEHIVEPQLQYQNSKIVSLVYSYYQYSGGAHGMYGITTFNYDKKDGTVVNIDNLSSNIDSLTVIAQKAFVEQNGSLDDFWFDDDGFYLPNTFYFDTDYIIFYYHLYDIAPYAAGDFKVMLSNDEVKHLVKYIE
ncbi:MAG: DUF3298 and DUF4163 domain-containing protein [Prevotellaceae bacterium]|jgi:hypothetical protein|nr:DUF3298 and DUF4163 domain-containing protein [Prevotellaceae bacterium]